MFALLYKDYLLHRKYIFLMMIITAFMAKGIFKHRELMVWALSIQFTLLAFTMILLESSIRLDDKDKVRLFVLSSSLSVKEYVFSKFALLWCAAIYGSFLTFVMIYSVSQGIKELFFVTTLSTALFLLIGSIFLILSLFFLGGIKVNLLFGGVYLFLLFTLRSGKDYLAHLFWRLLSLRYGLALTIFLVSGVLLLQYLAVKTIETRLKRVIGRGLVE